MLIRKAQGCPAPDMRNTKNLTGFSNWFHGSARMSGRVVFGLLLNGAFYKLPGGLFSCLNLYRAIGGELNVFEVIEP